MNSDSPLRTIKFRPLPRSRKTEHVRPLKTILIAPPPRGEKRPLKTIHIAPPPRPPLVRLRRAANRARNYLVLTFP